MPKAPKGAEGTRNAEGIPRMAKPFYSGEARVKGKKSKKKARNIEVCCANFYLLLLVTTWGCHSKGKGK